MRDSLASHAHQLLSLPFVTTPIKAIAAWRRALGARAVITTPAALEEAERATFATTGEVDAIVKVRSEADVQAALRVAAQCRMPVHPISRGLNWGYGSRVPPGASAALLDLSALNRIDQYDAQLGTVRVQAGVTFEQLNTFLARRKSRFAVSATGGPPTGSVLANALERGLGMGPYGDHFAHIRALDVVLPTGTRIGTGLARFKKAQSVAVDRWGVGPVLDGLFSQSALGVVLSAHLSLWPVPPCHAELMLGLSSQEQLPKVIDTLREARWDNVLEAPYRITNDYRELTRSQRFPSKPDGFLPWNGLTHVWGRDAEEVLARRTTLAERLREVCQFVLEGPVRTGFDLADALRPSWSDVHAARWRKRTPSPSGTPDLDREHVGAIWFSAVIPERGTSVARAAQLVGRIVKAHDLEPMITLRTVEGRAVYLIGALLFDRDVPGEDQRALTCHAALEKTLTAQGLFPYRTGRATAALPVSTTDALADLLKQALDPHALLASPRRARRSR